MEPTNRRETGTRPSAMKRYGPFIGIVVVIAIIVGVVIAHRRWWRRQQGQEGEHQRHRSRPRVAR